MPRTVITPTNVDFQESTDLIIEVADADNGMMFVNDGSCVLIVQNADDMLTTTVTIVAVPDEAGRAVDYTKEINVESAEIFGPFRPEWWSQTEENVGFIYVDITSDTNVGVGVINF